MRDPPSRRNQRAGNGIVGPMAEVVELISGALGVACFAGLIAAAAYLLLSRARSSGLLAPVVVGLGLRIAVMAIAHAGSVSLGEGGFMHLDDAGYAAQADELARLWRDGQIVDPAAHDLVGSYQFGFPVLVGAVFTLVGSHVLVAKLLNVLAGAGTVLISGLIAREILGPSAARRTAWLVALAPSVIWWSAPLLKEGVATFLVVAAVFAMLRLPRSWAILSLLLALLLIVRSTSVAVLLVSLAAGLALAARHAGRRIPWRTVILGTATGLALGVLAAMVISRGHPVAWFDSYVATLERMVDRYQGSDPTQIPLDTLKSFVTPYPWAFDLGTRSWNRGLYPGMWLWYAVYPVALLGCWRLRHRPELAFIGLAVLLTVIVTSISSGFAFRQRSTVEPLILLLACAGLTSWRVAARVGAAGLLVAALAATFQSGSITTGLAVAAGAIALLCLAQALPATDLRTPLPPSPLVRVIIGGDRPRPVSDLLGAMHLWGRRLRDAGPEQGSVPRSPTQLSASLSRLRSSKPNSARPFSAAGTVAATAALRAAAPAASSGAQGSDRAAGPRVTGLRHARALAPPLSPGPRLGLDRLAAWRARLAPRTQGTDGTHD